MLPLVTILKWSNQFVTLVGRTGIDPPGNQLEDSFEQIALAFNNIIRMASAAEFPTVSFTPISIYRTVEPRLRRRAHTRALEAGADG